MVNYNMYKTCDLTTRVSNRIENVQEGVGKSNDGVNNASNIERTKEKFSLKYYFVSKVKGKKSVKSALDLCKQLLDAVDAYSKYEFGNCFEHCVGVEIDLSKAMEFYQMSSQSGRTKAK